MNYASIVTDTAQTTPDLSRPEMVKNSAGGYVFAVSDEQRLLRFLILGTEGGTYYASQKDHTMQASEFLVDLIKRDGSLVLRNIFSVSCSTPPRAPKNDATIFALACCVKFGNEDIKSLALDMIPEVCRIGTHLYQFLDACKRLKVGWGRSFKRAIAKWVLGKGAFSFAFQSQKYQSRDGWAMRDVLRLSHPKSESASMQIAMKAALDRKKALEAERTDDTADVYDFLSAVQSCLDEETDEQTIIHDVDCFKLPHEVINTKHMTNVNVQRALWGSMGLTAMMRNLGRFTASGMLAPLSKEVNYFVQKIGNADELKKARIHPINVLTSLLTYKSGKGIKGSLFWTPNGQIVKALEEAVTASMKFVQPTGKRHLIAIDISGSMHMTDMMGVPGFSPAMAAAVLAKMYSLTEPQVHLIGFGREIVDLDHLLSKSFTEIAAATKNMNFGSTDCAAPMIYASKKKIEADVFQIITDNETWVGYVKPHQALVDYRKQFGIKAKLVVHGMIASNFTIADPEDGGMMDVVGFDTAAPQIIAEFCRM